MQQYAAIYLLQNYSTCFGCSSHASSGVHKNVTAASGTGHSNNLPPTWPKATLEEGCCYVLYQRLQIEFYVPMMMGAMDTRNM